MIFFDTLSTGFQPQVTKLKLQEPVLEQALRRAAGDGAHHGVLLLCGLRVGQGPNRWASQVPTLPTPTFLGDFTRQKMPILLGTNGNLQLIVND